MKIKEYIGRDADGDIGIEIEVEGANLPDGDYLWRRERDGSLRGAENAEYVLKQPIPINKVDETLANLKKRFVANGATFDESPRAGVHIHLNVGDLSLKQFMTLVCAYVSLEELFIRFCDKSRDGNLFCLPTYSASYLISAIRKSCEIENINDLNTDNIRYASINVKSLFKYGSVEFRALESTYNFDKIATWAKMLYKLKKIALQYDNPADLMMSFSRNDYQNMVRDIMEEYAAGFLAHPDFQQVVRQGVLRAQDIAFSRDWGAKNLNIFKKAGGLFN